MLIIRVLLSAQNIYVVEDNLRILSMLMKWNSACIILAESKLLLILQAFIRLVTSFSKEYGKSSFRRNERIYVLYCIIERRRQREKRRSVTRASSRDREPAVRDRTLIRKWRNTIAREYVLLLGENNTRWIFTVVLWNLVIDAVSLKFYWGSSITYIQCHLRYTPWHKPTSLQNICSISGFFFSFFMIVMFKYKTGDSVISSLRVHKVGHILFLKNNNLKLRWSSKFQ